MEEIYESGAVEAVAPVEAEKAESIAEEAVPPKKKRKPINQQKLQDNLWGWIFCLPLIVGTVWFVYSAFVMALMLSFTNYSMGSSGKTLFEVLGNLGATMRPKTDENGLVIPGTADPFYWYARAFTDTITSKSTNTVYNEMGLYLFNTVFYMIGIPIGMILSMFFAVCMSRDIKGGNVFRVLYYIPCVASTISVVYTFRTMFNPSGVINKLFGCEGLQWMASGSRTWNDVFGQTSSNAFMGDPYWCQGFLSKLVIVIMSVWKGLGGTIILYVAGLSGVNAATKEAAQIDGANGWQIFWKVTMPDLYPTIFYNIVTSVIGGMQIYMEPVLLFGESSPLQGNSYFTNGYVSLIYRHGLNTAGEHPMEGQIPSAGAAYGMILAVMIFVMTLFQFWLDSRKKD